MTIDFSKYPFPVRIRHHVSPNQYLPLTELKEIPENYPPVYKEINWPEQFANAKPPDVLDIGCGKGALLLDFALKNPELNIMGIEVRKHAVAWINTIIDGEKIPNCRGLWYSVVNGLDFLEPETVKDVLYLFPDPWYKRRHIKRRAFSKTFLDDISRVFLPGGNLYLATDLENIHEYHLKIVSGHEKFNYREIEDDSEWNLPMTNKEKFCRRKGIKFYRLIASKI